MSWIKDLGGLFAAMDFKDWIGVIVLTVLFLGVLQGFTDRDLFGGIPFLGDIMDAIAALIPAELSLGGA